MSDPAPAVGSMLGAYGEWAADLLGDGPARLSFRRPEWTDVTAWSEAGRRRVLDAMLAPDSLATPPPVPTVEHRYELDGVAIELLRWQLPYGPPTDAVFLRPLAAGAGAGAGRLPGFLALHDHGGRKYFGTRKITRVGRLPHPIMERHQTDFYGGVAWANELAKRGYAVLVHDAFLFGSRRVRVGDVPDVIRQGLTEVNPEAVEEIELYEAFAAEQEHRTAKSLFCAGTTWPGVCLSEDLRALDYLCSRPEVDAGRIGCGGLSGGGLRTVYLAGLDRRIRCAVCVGMMTTWRDFLLHKCHTHTWMIYLPGLPRELDYPEILALRAPAHTLVLHCAEDPLFTPGEMRRADAILRETFAKAGAADRYRSTFHPGGHQFNLAMQKEAFDWLDQWL